MCMSNDAPLAAPLHHTSGRKGFFLEPKTAILMTLDARPQDAKEDTGCQKVDLASFGVPVSV